MGYVVALLIVCLGVLLGKVIISCLNLEKSKHPLVYGLFAYFSGFFVLSGPFTFLHLHWNLYFFVQSCYHLALIGLIIFAFYRKKITLELSLHALTQYVRDNYLIIILALFFTFMSFASNNTLVGGATGDDIVYLSWAANNIGNTIYPPGIDLIDGKAASGDLLGLLSFLQLYWAYIQQALGVDLVVFVRTSMSIVTYIWFFCTIDEVIFVFTDKRQYARFKYTMLVAGLFYYAEGLQSEIYKFMYNPWFGNTFSLMLHVPFALLFFWHSLRNKKALYLVGLLPFVSAGFSPVSILYTGLTFFPLALLWTKYKTYTIRHERKILYMSLLCSLLFLAVSMFPNARRFAQFILNRDTRAGIIQLSEMWLFRTALNQRLLYIIPGLTIFFYRLGRKEVRRIEQAFVLFPLAIIMLSCVPQLDKLLFVAFSFPLRRMLDTYMTAFVFYSGAMILASFRHVKWPYFLLAFVLCSFAIQVGPGFYFAGPLFKTQFNLNNVLREKRLDPALAELEEFLMVNATEKTNVCTFETREWPSITGDERIDIIIAIAPVTNAYFNCELPQDPHQRIYYVTSNISALEQKITDGDLRLAKHIDTGDFTFDVYEYIRV
jgi:hypothetical protein